MKFVFGSVPRPSRLADRAYPIGMAKFFFDVRERPRLVYDEHGLECANIAVAEREAARAASDMSRDLVRRGELCTVIVEVRDNRDRRMLTAMASLTAELVHLEP